MINKLFLFREEAELEAYKLQRAWTYHSPRPCLLDILEDYYEPVRPAELPAPLFKTRFESIVMRDYYGQEIQLAWIREVKEFGDLAAMCNAYAIDPSRDSELIRHACIKKGWIDLLCVHDRNFLACKARAYDPVCHETLIFDKTLGWVIDIRHPEEIHAAYYTKANTKAATVEEEIDSAF